MPSLDKWKGLLIGLALLFTGAAVGIWFLRPTITEEAVREVVLTTIQMEAPASFYVTGTIDLSTTVIARSTKVLLPDLLGLDLGTTEATVRVPGRVSYGFDVRDLRPEAIRLTEEGKIDVLLPDLKVYAVEPDLAAMEVQTSVGWARLRSSSGVRQEREAIRAVQPAMRTQAERHLETSSQPRLNTARALETLLTPVLQAAGVDRPAFRFQIGPGLVLEPEG